MKKLLFTCLLVAITVSGYTQIDTLNFPKERREIQTLMHDPEFKAQTQKDCNDLVTVGPKGDINYSLTQWKDSQVKEKLIFKSVTIVPGSDIIRVYGPATAVVNWLADVHLNVQGHDVAIKVRRLEVFIKKGGSWCMVAGQGTQVDEKLFPILR
jgi:hypothetical protein